MSILELDGTALDSVYVQAVMLFPQDREKISQYCAIHETRKVLLDLKDQKGNMAEDEYLSGSTIGIDARTLELILQAPAYETLKAEIKINTKRGLMAGDILSVLYLMDAFEMPEPSINKAIHVLRAYAKEAKYGDGSKIPMSEKYIRDYWREYQSVSHFWAALRLHQSYPFSSIKNVFDEVELLKFLQAAQGLFHFACNFTPGRVNENLKKPLLDESTTWKIPSNITPIRLTSSRYPTRLADFLKNYAAPEAAY